MLNTNPRSTVEVPPGAEVPTILREFLAQVPGGCPEANSQGDNLYRIAPLEDSRWPELLERHPRASVFHSAPWLEALFLTYGYEPVAFTTSGPGEVLRDGAVFCRVNSWLTGSRLVSLPFSDHCDLLDAGAGDFRAFGQALEQEIKKEDISYFEIRPLQAFPFSSSLCHLCAFYRFHQLDLCPDIDSLFSKMHKGSVQRKIVRAQREGLRYEEGTGRTHLDSFHNLQAITRRRHNLPPQPKSWFRNLIRTFGDALKIRLALKDGRPIAGMITLRYKDTLTYKYGGSDTRYNNLGGMHLVYWEAIQDAKKAGLRTFDLGRTDFHQTGLIRFKRRWGATESTLRYFRYSRAGRARHIFDQGTAYQKIQLLQLGVRHTPLCVLSFIGSVLYKHAG